jgi:molybdopterin-guanine dinucleotide biosynthesis protein A
VAGTARATIAPVGALLAGGRGRRLGGDKAIVDLDGRPLLSYPLAALREALPEVAVVAKRQTELPPLPAGVAVWIEPDEPSHPLAGIVHALRMARGRRVLVCPVDLPLVTASHLRRLADSGSGGSVVARAGGRLQPLLAVYVSAALPGLERSLARDASMHAAVAAIGAREIDFGDDDALLCNVNAPEDVLRVSAQLHTGA